MSETLDNNKSNTNINFDEMSAPRETTQIDIENDRYPYSIVWTPIPVSDQSKISANVSEKFLKSSR